MADRVRTRSKTSNKRSRQDTSMFGQLVIISLQIIFVEEKKYYSPTNSYLALGDLGFTWHTGL